MPPTKKFISDAPIKVDIPFKNSLSLNFVIILLEQPWKLNIFKK